MHTHKPTVYLIRSGWVYEDKRHGFGDGETQEETFAPSLGEAEAIFDRYVARCSGTVDRGDYWARDTVEIYECDENDEFAGLPVKSYRSPLPGS